MFADADAIDNIPVGDCVDEGVSEGRNDAGEEGGATKGNTIEGGWDECTAVVESAPEEEVSGARMACPIRLVLGDPKHQ